MYDYFLGALLLALGLTANEGVRRALPALAGAAALAGATLVGAPAFRLARVPITLNDVARCIPVIRKRANIPLTTTKINSGVAIAFQYMSMLTVVQVISLV